MAYQLSDALSKDKVFLVRRSELEERLDCEYYNPSHYRDLALLKNSPYCTSKLKDVCVRIVDGPFGSAIKADDYVEDGVPFIRVADVTHGEGTIKTDNLIYISHEAHKEISRSKVIPGDVVIAKTGATMGAASVVPDEIPEANIRGDLAALTLLKDRCSPEYAITYINTPLGQRLFWRLDSGGTRGRVVIGNLKKYPVVIPPHVIQNSIVAKMNSARAAKKQKEAQALQLLYSIDIYLLSALGIELPPEEENTLSQRMFFRKFSEVSGGRFDAAAMQQKVEKTRKAIMSGFFKTDKLKHVVTFNAEQVTEIEGRTYIGLENIQSNTGEYVSSEEKMSISSAGTFKQDDILFPKLRPYLNKVFHASFDGVCSTEFHVLQAVQIEPAFLSFFLRSKAVVNQTTCLMTGNTLPRLQTVDILNLDIPLPPLKKQNEVAAHIQTIRDQAKQLRADAVAGLEQARLEVEAMILAKETAI